MPRAARCSVRPAPRAYPRVHARANAPASGACERGARHVATGRHAALASIAIAGARAQGAAFGLRACGPAWVGARLGSAQVVGQAQDPRRPWVGAGHPWERRRASGHWGGGHGVGAGHAVVAQAAPGVVGAPWGGKGRSVWMVVASAGLQDGAPICTRANLRNPLDQWTGDSA